MKRMLAFLVLISCVAIGNALAKDIFIVPIPSGGAQHGSTDATAAVFSSVLTDIAADMALKAARDHGPEAVRGFQKHGPALLKTMRKWTETALNSGGRYAVQTLSCGKKFVPQVLTGGKDIGLSSLQASMGIAHKGFSGLLKVSETGPARTTGQSKTSSKSGHLRTPKKTTGS
jgi:hypothetical protein